VLAPTGESIEAIDDAEAPSIAIFDRVIATGDATHALVAQYMKLSLMDGNTARLFASIPQLSPQMSRDEVADHYKLRMTVGVLVEPWRHRSIAIRRAIAVIVYRHPELVTHDPVVAYMIANSRITEAAGMASR
jgi:hypothetical protein